MTSILAVECGFLSGGSSGGFAGSATLRLTKASGGKGPSMVLTTVAATVLQFSGDFIELAIGFAILAIVAALVGARGVAGISMTVAKWLIIIFIVLAIISAVL